MDNNSDTDMSSIISTPCATQLMKLIFHFKTLLYTNTIETHALKSWVTIIELTRIETHDLKSWDTSFLVLKIGKCDDLDNIKTVMEAPTHIK